MCEVWYGWDDVIDLWIVVYIVFIEKVVGSYCVKGF